MSFLFLVFMYMLLHRFRYFLSLNLSMLVLSVAVLFGCSARISTDTVEVRTLLVSLTALYLSHLTMNDTRQLRGEIFWEEYLVNNPEISKKQFFDLVNELSKRWTPDNSPVSHLSVTSVIISDRHAHVFMNKLQEPESTNAEAGSTDIQVDFMWIGSGWMIVDDNIMGVGDVIPVSLSKR